MTGPGDGRARAGHGDPLATLTADEAVRAVGGRLLSGAASTPVGRVWIDSRTLEPGDLYVAIRGERLDGHAFVVAAFERGAGGALVSEPVKGLTPARLGDRILIAVKDTTAALQGLANHVRRASGAQVVAITGSAGKTTTKELAAAFLALRYRVMRSSGNRNNHIGLPLSLLELRRGAEVAVVELGMSRAGEVRRLTAIAEPETRVWTNVAEVHSAFFPSLDAIADAKAELLEGAKAGHVLVANADDPLVMARVGRFAGRVVTFGTAMDATVSATEVENLGLDGTRATVRARGASAAWRLRLLGRGSLMNSLAAAAVGLELGVPLSEMAEVAAALGPAARRGEVLRLSGGVTIVDDSYNSNPRALTGALAVLAAVTGSARRVAVLGEMLELGTQATALHEACGRAAAASGLGALVDIGGEPARALGRAAVEAGLPAEAVHHAADSGEAAELAARIVRPGDVVLVKGSRGIGTEAVVERLKAQFG